MIAVARNVGLVSTALAIGTVPWGFVPEGVRVPLLVRPLRVGARMGR